MLPILIRSITSCYLLWRRNSRWRLHFDDLGGVQGGDQLSQQEILSSDEHPFFQTEADIDLMCAQLESAAELLKDTELGDASKVVVESKY